MPTPYPKEFRRDVIAAARQGDRTIPQVARRFGISESCLHRWLRIAEREEGGVPDTPLATGADLAAEVKELRKKAARLEQENEILRRVTAYFARDTLPKCTRWSSIWPTRRSPSR